MSLLLPAEEAKYRDHGGGGVGARRAIALRPYHFFENDEEL